MDQNTKYPYRLANAFFITLHFSREQTLPEPLKLPIESQIKVIDQDFPRIQINLRNSTPEQSPLKLDIELVGLFDYVGDNPEQDRQHINEFIQEKGLHMLWSYLTQMVRMVTGQMGMSPLEIKTPLSFGNPFVKEAEQTQNEPPTQEPG